jgi:hypothetical protein
MLIRQGILFTFWWLTQDPSFIPTPSIRATFSPWMERVLKIPGLYISADSDNIEKYHQARCWDINPKRPRRERREWKRMLRKHRKAFAGTEARLAINLIHLETYTASKCLDKRGRYVKPAVLHREVIVFSALRSQDRVDADIKAICSQQPYRTSPRKRKLINDAVRALSKLDVIQPSNSEVASPVVVVVRKGKPRFFIDLREVKSNTVADRYALPKQDSIFHGLAKAIYFSIIDANKGYHQFGLSSRSRRFTAFVTEDGFWEFWRVPFGLKNAPAHFQLAMDAILGSYRYEFALAFIDDIVIYSRTLSDHRMHVSLVLEALEKVGMTVVEQKYHFATFTI